MRLLGVDYGSVRIGLAVAESGPGVATARLPMKPSGSLAKDAAALAKFARAEECDLVVIGLPLEQGGVEGRMARITRSVASLIEAHGVGVGLVDESLTSVEANSALQSAGVKAARGKRLIDGEAACRILERFMHES